jgi:hypothetical protein
MRNCLIFILVFSATLGTVALAEGPIPLKTEEEKAAFLTYIQKTIPGLLGQSIRYDFDLYKLIESQEMLQTKLNAMPGYKEALEKRGPKLEIDIKLSTPMVVTTNRIRPDAVEGWKEELQKNLETVKDGKNLSEEIRSLALDLSKKSSQGLLTGLIRAAVPAAEQDALFKVSRAEQKARLSQILPEEMPASFRGSAFQVGEGASKDVVLAKVRELEEKETRLKSLSELHLVLQNGSGEIEEKKEALSDKLSRLMVQDLEVFVDPDALGSRAKHLPLKNKKEITSEVQKRIQTYSNQTEEVQEKAQEALTLREMAPEIAIFRGCTGGDCSTAMSFPYPNDPNEKVFFLFDENKQLRGYLSSTVLNAGGKPSLYVLSINGPRVSASMAELALQALHQERKKLGVEQIVVTAKADGVFSNYANLIDLHKNRFGSDKKPHVALEYRNPDIRNQIQFHHSDNNTAAYDYMSNNKLGIIYEPLSEKLKIKTQTKTMVEEPYKAIADRELGFVTAIKLLYEGKEAGKRLLKGMKIPHDEAVLFSSAMRNPKALPLKEHRQELESLLGQVKIDLEVLNTAPELLELGSLSSPDFLTSRSPGEIARVLDHLFEMSSESLMYAMRNEDNRARYVKSPAIQEYLINLADGSYDKFTKFCLLADSLQFRPDASLISRLIKRIGTQANFSEPLLFYLKRLAGNDGLNGKHFDEVLDAWKELPNEASKATQRQQVIDILKRGAKRGVLGEAHLKRVIEEMFLDKKNGPYPHYLQAILKRAVEAGVIGEKFLDEYLASKLGVYELGELYWEAGRFPSSYLDKLHQELSYLDHPENVRRGLELLDHAHALRQLEKKHILPFVKAIARMAPLNKKFSPDIYAQAMMLMRIFRNRGLLTDDILKDIDIRSWVSDTPMEEIVYPQQLVQTLPDGRHLCIGIQMKIGQQ